MENVISFAAFANARRVDIELDRREAVKVASNQKRRETLSAEFAVAGTSGEVFANILANVIEAKEDSEKVSKYVPAYCDPANEVQGSRYTATRGESLPELAKRMRAEIKDAVKAGRLPKGLKVSVRSQYFSGGGSIDMRITAIPETMAVYEPAYLLHLKEREGGAWLPYHGNQHSEEFAPVMEMLERIHKSYNRDNSDSMTDYFDVRYYGDVSLDWRISYDIRDRETVAALASVEG